MNSSQADWVPVSGFEGFYEIHPTGQVRSLDRVTTGKHGKQITPGKLLKPILNTSTGYYVVNLTRNGYRRQFRLHILVAQHFIPNPEGKPTVNHKTGLKARNAANDLEWSTHQEQMTHAAATGLTASGERNGANKVTDLMAHEAFHRCMSGEELSKVSSDLGVNRNTLPKAFKRLGFGEVWQEEARRRKATASMKRWGIAA